MIGLIDTHTHLYLPEFLAEEGAFESPDAVDRAVSAGVGHMIFPNVDLTTIEPMKRLAAAHPGRVSMAMGLHPTEVADDWREALSIVESEICRNALDETLEVMQGHPAVQAVMHSFGGDPEDARRILRAGKYYFGINGILTFKRSTLPEAIKEIPADRLLLETDAPYLAPVPMRGRRNESAYLVHTAARMAEILGKSPEEIADTTSANAERLFRIA